MSYRKRTAFAVKDTLGDTNPLKVIRGKEFDDEFDAITVAMDEQEAVIANLAATPVGAILMYAGGVAPTGFLLCDGAARSRSTYAALFQVVGTTYGLGNGGTTFNVPNLSERFPYGATPGQLGGSADSIVPSHAHTASVAISDPGHAHGIGVSSTLDTSGGTYRLPGAGSASTSMSATTGITASATVNSTGVSPTNTNLPPFLGLSFIIKI